MGQFYPLDLRAYIIINSDKFYNSIRTLELIHAIDYLDHIIIESQGQDNMGKENNKKITTSSKKEHRAKSTSKPRFQSSSSQTKYIKQMIKQNDQIIADLTDRKKILKGEIKIYQSQKQSQFREKMINGLKQQIQIIVEKRMQAIINSGKLTTMWIAELNIPDVTPEFQQQIKKQTENEKLNIGSKKKEFSDSVYANNKQNSNSQVQTAFFLTFLNLSFRSKQRALQIKITMRQFQIQAAKEKNKEQCALARVTWITLLPDFQCRSRTHSGLFMVVIKVLKKCSVLKESFLLISNMN